MLTWRKQFIEEKTNKVWGIYCIVLYINLQAEAMRVQAAVAGGCFDECSRVRNVQLGR
jgi:hypothetical protein